MCVEAAFSREDEEITDLSMLFTMCESKLDYNNSKHRR